MLIRGKTIKLTTPDLASFLSLNEYANAVNGCKCAFMCKNFSLSVRDQLFFLYTECILRIGNDEGPGTQEM